MPRRGFGDGVRAILGLTPAAFAFGASFAVLAHAAGVGGLAATVMSATTFAGSAQVATVSILGTGGGLAAAVVAALLLNARYGAISVSVAPGFRGSFLRRLVESQLIVDESWAVSVQPDGRVERRVLLGAGATLWIFWTTGTVVGAVAGEAIGDPNRLGRLTHVAGLIALLAPQLRNRRAVAAALIGAAIAFALIPFTPAGVPIVAATAACLAGWRR